MDVTRATVRQSVTTTAGMCVQQPNVPTLNSHVNATIYLPINVSRDVFVVISNGNAWVLQLCANQYDIYDDSMWGKH